MSTDEIRVRWTAGAVVRRYVRTALALYGVEYVENKGLFESDFVLIGTPDQIQKAADYLVPLAQEAGQ